MQNEGQPVELPVEQPQPAPQSFTRYCANKRGCPAR